MDLKLIDIKKPAEMNFILGQSHFIKTVEDLYEALITSAPGIKFGLAFCEASGERLIRTEGNDQELIDLAITNAKLIAAGHSFIIFLREAYPINVLGRIKDVQELCSVFCATSNPAQVLLVESDKGRGILGVIDGQPPLGVEDQTKKKERQELMMKFGYKR